MRNANIPPENAFVRGFHNCSEAKSAAIRREIMHDLNLRSAISFYNRKFGFVLHTPCERAAIERAFSRHGVASDQVWGIPDTPNHPF